MIAEIRKILESKSSRAAKAAAEKFVPGVEKVYGVRTPVLNELAKKFKSGGFKLVEELWEGSFEEKILAGKLLGRIAKQDPEKSLALVRRFSTEISDWAVCDTLGMQSLKPIVKTHGDEIFELSRQLIRSRKFWQRRLALVLVEWYTREKSRHKEIRSLINKVKKDEEYYVRKAVVWLEKNFNKGK